MASTTLTADRRWASSRKSGMTVLGKVPKPINLPSRRLENNGLDPNVETVPKGTITWGSRPTSSSNAWNSSFSILSSKIVATASSPPNLMGRPGSSGSSTRPSTGNTDRQLGPDPSHAWGPNSRPSSASGSFASGHPLASPNHPRSADTWPGSSHLSRFAESSGESKDFTLSSGDFPTLGAEKPTESHRGHSSHGRPTSGAGRDASPIQAFDTLPPSDFAKTTDIPQTQDVNILKTDDQSNTIWYPETPYQYPTHPYHQPGPNQPNIVLPVPPPRYDAPSWRTPPPQSMQQTPEDAMWYPPGPHAPAPHGPGPYRPTGPPNNYPIDQFVYYPPPPHFQPSTVDSAPRAHLPSPHNAYIMPAHPVSIPGRHGAHAPYVSVSPVSYESGIYSPSRPGFYGNRGHNHNNNRSNYHNSNNSHHAILNQGQNQSPRSSVTGSDVASKQYKFLKQKEEENKDEKQPEPSVMTHGNHSSEHSNQQQSIVRKNTALSQKIDELNSKARSIESSHAEIKEEKPKPGEDILGTPSGVIEAEGMSIHLRIGEEFTTVQEHHAERRSNEQRRMRQRPGQVSNQVAPVKNDALLENTTAGSDKVHSLQKEGDDSMASDANLPSDPAEYEIQRLLLKEKAAQRAKELQREEEERIREQKAKALAKLEELNRRATAQKEPVDKESDPSPPISDSHFQQEHLDVITTDGHLQAAPPKSAEISNVATMTLSFGTISDVQITTGQVTQISEVPISSVKTSADVGAEIKEEKPKPGEGILGTPSGIIEAGGMSVHLRIGEDFTTVRQHHAERRLNEQRRMRQRPGQVPNQVAPVKNDTLLENTTTAGSDKVHSLQKEGDVIMASDANLPSDPAEYEFQRLLLKEKAAQRAKELQREEEERIQEQKAKALAKLEELNRRAITQKEPVHTESDHSPPISDSHFQQEHLDVITTDTHLQAELLKSAEISNIATVTLSFGTISKVQITTGQVTHILEVPISFMKTSADAGATAGAPVTGSGASTGPGAVVSAGPGTSSHTRHHNGKMGYKKRHSSNMNPSAELRAAGKTTNVGAILENPTEHLKQTDAQVSVGESTQHKDDTVTHHRKRGNKNPKSRSKMEVPLPVSVPVQSVAPLQEKPEKGLNEKVETASSTAPTSENTNSVPPDDSSKDVSKPLEVELRAGGGNTRVGPNWKAQQQRRLVRNHRTISDKSHINETVVWAPVRHPKEENTHSSGTSDTVAALKNDGEVHTCVKTKRAEIERYVPKPQLSQLEKKQDDSTDVNAGSPPEAKAGEVDSRTIISSNSTNNLNKSMWHGKPHSSWRQRVGTVEMHETMFPNPTDGEKTLVSDTQSVMPIPTDHEDNVAGRPRRHNGHNLYKVTSRNYGDHGAARRETESITEIVDCAITGMEGKSQNMESGSCGVLNYSSNTRSHHWKPKSQSHVYSHGKGNVGWQKVVSDKVGPISRKGQDEDKPVASSASEDSGAAPRRQRGNARQYKSGSSEERESNREFQPVVRSYQRVTEEDGMEGGNRAATGSRYRGRGRNGHFAHQASELSI